MKVKKISENKKIVESPKCHGCGVEFRELKGLVFYIGELAKCESCYYAG